MRLRAAGLELEQSPVSMAGIVMAADLAESGEISSKMLKQLLDMRLRRTRIFRPCMSGRSRSRYRIRARLRR